MTLRTDKVASLLKRELGQFLHQLELPAMVTVTRAEVSLDLKRAKIFVSILPADEDTEKKFLALVYDHRAEIQSLLNKKLTMKFVPKVLFLVDYSSEYASHINRLLKKAHEDEHPI